MGDEAFETGAYPGELCPIGDLEDRLGPPRTMTRLGKRAAG